MYYEEIGMVDEIRRQQQGPQEDASEDAHIDHLVHSCDPASVLDPVASTAA